MCNVLFKQFPLVDKNYNLYDKCWIEPQIKKMCQLFLYYNHVRKDDMDFKILMGLPNF